jgi:hypothetical protein
MKALHSLASDVYKNPLLILSYQLCFGCVLHAHPYFPHLFITLIIFTTKFRSWSFSLCSIHPSSLDHLSCHAVTDENILWNDRWNYIALPKGFYKAVGSMYYKMAAADIIWLTDRCVRQFLIHTLHLPRAHWFRLAEDMQDVQLFNYLHSLVIPRLNVFLRTCCLSFVAGCKRGGGRMVSRPDFACQTHLIQIVFLKQKLIVSPVPTLRARHKSPRWFTRCPGSECQFLHKSLIASAEMAVWE